MRAWYASKEEALEQKVYRIRAGFEPEFSEFEEFMALPSELPRLDDFDAMYFYIINLDQEVFTMNYTIHWKLSNIPRQNNLWHQAIENSVYMNKQTISSTICPEEHMASLALKMPKKNMTISYDFHTVAPKIHIQETRKVFLTRFLAAVMVEYKNEIIRFAREWSPDSFPFRELAFALVSIASENFKFHSFPAQPCNPRTCSFVYCKSNHLPESPGWLDKDWAGNDAPLLEFGSMSHRENEPSGASPTETMYWHENVLINLVLVPDGEAVTKAATWGIEQGRANFQVIVMSLFQVIFAEISFSRKRRPFIKVSEAVQLSPLYESYCTSTHPRERPVLKSGMEPQYHYGELVMQSNCTGTVRKLRNYFPGLAAMVNFFDAAASRCAASKLTSLLPLEVYHRILDFVDYDTWKSCSMVSHELRLYCLSKYRIDSCTRIVAGPFIRMDKYSKKRVVSFNFENMKTGKIVPMTEYRRNFETKQCNWMPLIGSGRRVLMLDVFIQFESAENEPVQSESDDKPY